MSVPSFCTNCGNLFVTQGISITGNAKNISFTNSKTRCPNCGSVANILDGTYDFYNGVIEVVKGSNFTKETAEKLFNISKAAIDNKIDTKTAFDKMEQIDPQTMGKLKKFYEADMSTKIQFSILMIILIFLGGYLGGVASELGKQTVLSYQEHHK